MNNAYDCIVVGVGGFGSGAMYHLAKRGQRVLGIERFGVAHDRGSSHGETRIIRKAYFEHPDYVPLLLTAYDLWDDLHSEFQSHLADSTLYQPSGLLLAGPPEGETITGALLAARQHSLPIEELTTSEAESRFPGFKIPDGFATVFESDAGFLHVERCVQAHVDCAIARGADLHTDECVVDWESDGDSVRVTTDRGTYEAGHLILTPGAWANGVLQSVPLSLDVVRKLVFWHETRTPSYNLENGGTAFYFEMPYGTFYGFPSLDSKTVKLAEHSGGLPVDDPLALDREAHADDIDPVSSFIIEAMPHLDPHPIRHSACMYTFTPDCHFVVDRHPDKDNVFFGAGFSGHGFKFTSVIGKALSDLVVDGSTNHEIQFLRLNRDSLN